MPGASQPGGGPGVGVGFGVGAGLIPGHFSDYSRTAIVATTFTISPAIRNTVYAAIERTVLNIPTIRIKKF
jgi:hypothetical protein